MSQAIASVEKTGKSAKGLAFTALQQLPDPLLELMRRAQECQREIQASGVGKDPRDFYKRNSIWLEGLVTSARAVAAAFGLLVEMAGQPESARAATWKQAIKVSAQDVVASATQLVTAARVKAQPGSDRLARLEAASKQVKQLTGAMLSELAATTASEESGGVENGFQALSLHGDKVAEMDQRIKILSLEQQLSAERSKLSSLRKSQYQQH